MNNPIFNLFGGLQGFQQRLAQFQQQVQQTGTNPPQTVQHLMQSGQMSQEQFNQFSQIANIITGKRQF